MTADTPAIRRNEERNRFEVPVEGDGTATLSFERVSDEVIDYKSTVVPKEARGQGIAGKLVRHALDWARDERYKVIPTCSYVEAWIDKHPDYQDLVAAQ